MCLIWIWNSGIGEGMTEEQINLPKTAIIGTREEDAAVYPTLNALFQRS